MEHEISEIVNRMPGGIAIYEFGKTLRTLRYTDGIARMQGFTRAEYDEAVRADAMDIVYEVDRPLLMATAGQAAANGAELHISYRVYCKDRSVIWVNLSAYPAGFTENGAPRYYAMFSNTTSQFNLYQDICDNAATGAMVADAETGEIYYANQAIFSMLGQSFGPYAGTYARDVFPSEQPDAAARTFDPLEEQASYIYKVARNGNVLQMYARKILWMHRPAVLVYAEDITSEHQKQEELQSSRARLDAALECARVVEWRFDFVHDMVPDSGSLGRQYHWPRVIENVKQVLLTAEEKKRIHPDSAADFWWMYTHCRDGRRIEKELRYMAPDADKYLWFRVVFSPVFRADGRCTEVICTAVDVTEQKERELAYEEQLRLKKLAAKDAIVTADYNLTKNRVIQIDDASGKFGKTLEGASVDEALRMIRQNTGSEAEERQFAPVQDCKKMLDAFAHGTTHIEVRHHLKGEIRWVQTGFDMVMNPHTGDVEAIAILRDISGSVRAELVINRLLAVDYQAIFTIDSATGDILPLRRRNVDPHLQELIARQKRMGSCASGLAEHFGKYVVPEEREQAIRENSLEIVKKQLAETPVYATLYTMERDGRILHQRAMYTYLEENHAAILCAIHDVTETYQQEAQKKEELARALRTAEMANRSKTDFFSRMSHDMRTPMNGILGLANLSEGEQDINVLRNNMAQVKESGLYLLSLINDTLDFQRIESGKLTLNNQIVYTRDLLDNILAMIRPTMEEKKIQFRVINRNADLDWYIETDPVRIKQVMVNLLSNAVKFTPQGGSITLDVEMLSREGMVSHNCLKITDTGIGMSEDFVKNHLFRPFEQEQNTVTAQYAGSGLGLSIVKSLVQLMGGRIEVESEPGSGTTFLLYLDFHRVDAAAAENRLRREKETWPGEEQKLTGKSILLVEDHPLNAQIATRMLEKAGCRVHWENNGQNGAIAFQKAAPHTYDAVLMDVRMPVMDGLEATKAIRTLKRPDAATVPIIAMTANAFEEDIQSCLKAGMTCHLCKPIEPRTLYETLAEQIKA